ncbi:MAG: alpha-hydroxy acid oxidase [Bacteroidota bacterium]|nr:alpha-hydroxy acid oxidase [Bacteroidota bacterium]
MENFNSKYPSTKNLRDLASRKIPRFAFEYLDGGCNEDVNIKRNTSDIRNVELTPNYIRKSFTPNLRTELFGEVYDVPFGISPIGLQGLIWPNSPNILAKASKKYNSPFILSTVSTSDIETIAEITDGKAWFQLYYPSKESIRYNILKRAKDSGCTVLVLLCDVPTFGYRPKEIKNGLAMPPKMSLKNIFQILKCPEWTFKSLLHGKPNFQTLKPYMNGKMNLKQLGEFMNETFDGRLDEEKIKPIRDFWKGKIILKGIASEIDIEKSISLGIDGIIVSNHGGRQLDAGSSTIKSMKSLINKYEKKTTIMIDSGLRSGVDVARVIASGAKFCFLGRTFMYGVGALGNKGPNHTFEMLKKQLSQVMIQVGCEKISDLTKFINSKKQK